MTNFRDLDLRARWADGPALGAWMFLREPFVAEQAALAGYDYVCVDQQHGLAGATETAAMVQAMARTGATPLVRVAADEPHLIGRALDDGALGVIVPVVETAEQAARAVAACRYAPSGGRRSIGPIGATTRYGGRYVVEADAVVTCVPMVETVAGVEAVEEIAAVPGVDAIYVGPADLSLSLGLPPANAHDEPSFTAALDRVVAACREHGVVAGIQADPSLVPAWVERGFRMITVGYDRAPVVAGLRSDLRTARANLVT
jgi:4-hydroxy-2-oxoheptanedioate aldolase